MVGLGFVVVCLLVFLFVFLFVVFFVFLFLKFYFIEIKGIDTF